MNTAKAIIVRSKGDRCAPTAINTWRGDQEYSIPAHVLFRRLSAAARKAQRARAERVRLREESRLALMRSVGAEDRIKQLVREFWAI